MKETNPSSSDVGGINGKTMYIDKNFCAMKKDLSRIITANGAYRNAKRFQQLLERYMKNGFPVDFCESERDDTLLYITISRGHGQINEIADILLDAGAGVNYFNNLHNNALILAAKQSYGFRNADDIIGKVLQCTNNVNEKDINGRTAFMILFNRMCLYSFGTKLGNPDFQLVKLFLGAGASTELGDLNPPNVSQEQKYIILEKRRTLEQFISEYEKFKQELTGKHNKSDSYYGCEV